VHSDSIPSDWYRSFFHGLALDMWRAVVTPEMTAADVDFLVAALALGRGARVLDAPCGNGRHALELGKRGMRVTAFDLCEDFIAEARATSATVGGAVSFAVRDLRALDAVAEFDAVTCLGNSFGYLEHDDTVDWLYRVARALRPGGGFFLETGMLAESLLPHLEKTMEGDFGGIHGVIEHGYDVRRSRMLGTYTFTRGAERFSESMSQQIYTAAELTRILAAAGLEVRDILGAGAYGSAESRSFVLGDGYARIVARKR
jgi:SAM-dependent methyltransferase